MRGSPVRITGEREGSPALRQPCGALQSKCCAIYEQRPAPCRSFKCGLLRKVERGTLSFDEARARIEEAFELIAGSGLSPQHGPLLKQVLQNAWRGPADDPDRRVLERLADLISKHFLSDPAQER